jgi:hypothetical protein
MIRTCGDLDPIERDAPDGPLDGNTESEELELWMRDPVACIRELIGNPAFNGSVAYTPEKVYVDQEGQERQYDKMWSGDWWWKTQVRRSFLSSQTCT